MSREIEYAYSAQALPTPTDTPYRTPARSLSRRSSRHSSRHCNSSPGLSSSPPPFPPGGDSYFRGHGDSNDIANDETISILDPRRFTPTLHASLVSEILSLRRDLENKTILIENLETNLHTTKIENESITETLLNSTKETRVLKRQLQHLEGGSSSAFGELAQERDGALMSLSDVKQRLEVSQTKIRSQEEEADRTHALWDRDRVTWEGQRRNLERKVHVVEGRLKAVLDEIAAAQANELDHGGDFDVDEAAGDRVYGADSDRTSFRASSALNRRPMSGMSNSTYDGDAHNVRFSMLSGPNGRGGSRTNGRTLADELAFDEEEEDELDDSELNDGQMSPDALPEERQGRMSSQGWMSSLSISGEDQKARKVLGLPPEQEFIVAKGLDRLATEKVINIESDESLTAAHEIQYTDTGVQCSPPPSPGLKPLAEEVFQDERNEDHILTPLENGANQSRKRVSIGTVPPVDLSKVFPPIQTSTRIASSASQTLDDLPCRACKLKENSEVVSTSHNLHKVVGEMSPSATQIEEDQAQQTVERPSGLDVPGPQPVAIPTIAIHPPVSAPSTPRSSVVLPPRTKSTACQASIISAVKLRSISVQTEEIRIDSRASKLPENLLPCATSTHPPAKRLSNIEEDLDARESNDAVIQGVHVNIQNLPPARPPPQRPAPTEPEEAYPGNNDNGPLDRENGPRIMRPFRSSSLFAGFDLASDEEPGGILETDMSDDDFRNAAPIRKTLSKVHNSWKLVPQHNKAFEGSGLQEVEEETGTKYANGNVRSTTARKDMQPHSTKRRPSALKQSIAKPSETAPRWVNSAKKPDIRKSALISSGTAAHLEGSRSPGLPSPTGTAPTVSAPPFPVPTRSSSRKIPLSSSDGAQSPTPYGGGIFPGERHWESGRPPSKRPLVRKVRSAAAIPRAGHQGRNRSESPPPLRPSSTMPGSPRLPQLPPMPDGPAPSRYGDAVRHQHGQQLSSSNSDAGHTIVDSSVQQITVVDAIAQTMVGEWMWKYVRRRKSFGVTESPQADWEINRNAADASASITNSGSRHKRWVWLAPYERAVMWSSKQPTSGSALLGKSGRKLLIQSVLDVKDDTPYPKGSNPQQNFNRSILILTPQRALKFTATTKERHYIWLTALSFLSHSTLGVHDLDPRPPVPQREYEPPPRQNAPSLRRNPIRDSIRVAKGKARPNTNSARAYTSPAGGVPKEWMQGTKSNYAAQIEVPDAAEPPHVPRFSSHSRKRSNTGPRQPTTGPFRSIANHGAFTSNNSVHTTTSGETHAPSFFSGMRRGSAQSSLSPRTSEASAPPGVIVNNFFDAVGTVRMEAFVEKPRNDATQEQKQDQRPPRKSYRTRQGRKKDMGYWGANNAGHLQMGQQDGGGIPNRADDPFKGF